MISATSRAGLNVPRIACAAVGVACMVLWSCVSAADEGLAATPSFSDAEITIILSHGPWPTPVGPDPSNRVSGKPDAIEARDGPVLRSAPLRQRHEGLCDLSRSRAQLDRQPAARDRSGPARSRTRADVIGRRYAHGVDGAAADSLLSSRPAAIWNARSGGDARRPRPGPAAAMTRSCPARPAGCSAPRRHPPTTRRCS